MPMKIFGQLVGALVETVKLPVAVTKDVVTLGRADEPDEPLHTTEQLEAIKKAAQEPHE